MTARSVDAAALIDLIAEGAQLVEVLPEGEYSEEHLPRAINLSLKGLDQQSVTATLDRGRPVVVYCWDGLWNMSLRAAWRLTRLDYDVYDYTLGKADWLATGFPAEGTRTGPPRVLDAIDPAVPTCGPDDAFEAIADRFATSPWRVCVVVDDGRVILGKLRLAGPPPVRLSRRRHGARADHHPGGR